MTHLPPLTHDTFWAIMNGEIPDETVNQLVWDCLGYRKNETTGQWDTSNVAPEWLEVYPDEPPNFIGSRPATVKLTRSIPKPNKKLLQEELGFKGYTIQELTPTKTRRATAVNWLLSYVKIQKETVNH